MGRVYRIIKARTAQATAIKHGQAVLLTGLLSTEQISMLLASGRTAWNVKRLTVWIQEVWRNQRQGLAKSCIPVLQSSRGQLSNWQINQLS